MLMDHAGKCPALDMEDYQHDILSKPGENQMIDQMTGLYRLVHNWEEQAKACTLIRQWNETNNVNVGGDFFIRSKVFDSCAQELKQELKRKEEASELQPPKRRDTY
jgi:hypothetical protein